MPRQKDITAREEMASDIKRIARQQLAEKGTNGISLRGIARELGMTAPAIYNYFPRLDDLITALLVDAFTAHADAMDSAVAQHKNPVDQLRASLMAFREWAIEHPADFQLVYGNPIPGYEAPKEITVPLASRPQATLYQCILEAYQTNGMTIPIRYLYIPKGIIDFLDGWLYDRIPEMKDISYAIPIFTLMQIIWTRIHGIVMLEIHEHIGPTIGDVEALYRQEIEHFIEDIGLTTNYKNE